jgi:protein O-mannosyl-transferase
VATGSGQHERPPAWLNRALWADALVAGVALLVSVAALANGRALDDIPITAHPLLQSWRTLPAALGAAWWYDARHLYRPLTLVLLGAEQLAGGGAPLVPHAVNLVLHAAIAVALRRVYARLVPAGPALAAALLFAVLPVHAEAVASVVGQAELVSALALVGLWLLVTGQAPPTLGRAALATILAGAALAGKEQGVVAPVLVFAAAWAVPHQRRQAARWATAAALGTAVLLVARLCVLDTLAGDMPNPVFLYASVATRWRIALAMLPRAALMLMAPVPPAIDAVPTLAAIRQPAWGMIALGATLVVVAVAAAWRHLRRPNVWTLGAVIVAAGAAPTANLFFASGVVLDARTLYAASLGAGLLWAAVLAALHAHVPRGTAMLWAAAVVPGALMTRAEMPVWRDTNTVLATMRARQPDDYRAYLHLADLARARGHVALAVTYYRAAAARYPAEPEMLTDGAAVALTLHDTTTAVRWLEDALAATPTAARARTRLYGVRWARGERAAAERLLLEGLSLDPAQPTWQRLLARTVSADRSTAGGP